MEHCEICHSQIREDGNHSQMTSCVINKIAELEEAAEEWEVFEKHYFASDVKYRAKIAELEAETERLRGVITNIFALCVASEEQDDG